MADNMQMFPNNEIVRTYRNRYRGHEGAKVLYHQAFETGFFSDVPDVSPEAAALRAYLSRLLIILGGGEIGLNAFEAMVNVLLNQPLSDERTVIDAD